MARSRGELAKRHAARERVLADAGQPRSMDDLRGASSRAISRDASIRQVLSESGKSERKRTPLNQIARPGRTQDELRAASSRTTAATTAPRAARKSLPRIVGETRTADLRSALAPDNLAEQRRTAAMADPGKILKAGARVVGNTAASIGQAIYEDPSGAAYHSIVQAKDMAKGVIGATVGLGEHAATYNIRKEMHKLGGGDDPDSPITTAGNILKAGGEHFSHTYGPSARGEHGARGKMVEQFKHEGVLLPALDLATAVSGVTAPLGASVRAVARTRAASGAKPGILGAAGERTLRRPELRVSELGEAVPQRVRRSAVGATGTAASDAARAVAQRVAKKRAEERLRVAAVRKLTGKRIVAAPDAKPGGLLSTAPKPLTARRQQLKPGEVAPITNRGANRAIRRDVAQTVGRAEALGRNRAGRDTTMLRESKRGLTPELERAAVVAAHLGIKDAAGARNILPDRIAEIEAAVAKLPEAQRAKYGQNLDELRSLLATPHVFEDAGVLKARDAIRANPVGAREGLAPERGAHGRADLVGKTLGVKPARELNAEARAAHAAEKTAAHGKVDAAMAERAKLRATGARDLARARAELQGRRASGSGVAKAEAKLAAVQTRVAEQLAPVNERILAARAERKAAVAAKPAALKETAAEYESRVGEAAAARGLDAPAHVPSVKAQAAFPDKPRMTGAQGGGRATSLKARTGVNYDLGREAADITVIAQSRAKDLIKGARIKGESDVLAKHGRGFKDLDALTRYVQGLGYKDLEAAQRAGLDWTRPSTGMAEKGVAGPRVSKRAKGSKRPLKSAYAGDFVRTNDVFLMSKAAHDELKALGHQAKSPEVWARRFAHYPQTALLALNPAWYQFQRVNDLLAAGAGGSLLETRELQRLRAGLDPDSRDTLAAMAGGNMSRDMLTPMTGQKLGRMARILDENPTMRDALASPNPASALLLRAAHDAPTKLLRSDAKLTQGFRERQYLHDLGVVAKRMDKGVAEIHKAYAPLGHALKTGDAELLGKLLKDPAYQKVLEGAAERTARIHGDWSTYTAREQRLKHYAAFYGFLRYATKMALYTLPVAHPYIGAMIAQLGNAGADYAKSIIGPDMPYGLGALYNKDGSIIADFSRANPLVGPLFSIDRPEQLLSLATPLAGIVLNHVMGQPLALSDAANSYSKRYTSHGNPDSTAPLGGIFGEARTRILGQQLLRLLGPGAEWQRFDGRQQSSDSLPWDRRYLVDTSTSQTKQVDIDERNKAAAGGISGLAHNTLPLLFPGSSKNVAALGKSITAGKLKARQANELKAAKRKHSLESPLGRLDRRMALREARMAAREEAQSAHLAAMEHRQDMRDARMGN